LVLDNIIRKKEEGRRKKEEERCNNRRVHTAHLTPTDTIKIDRLQVLTKSIRFT